MTITYDEMEGVWVIVEGEEATEVDKVRILVSVVSGEYAGELETVGEAEVIVVEREGQKVGWIVEPGMRPEEAEAA